MVLLIEVGSRIDFVPCYCAQLRIEVAIGLISLIDHVVVIVRIVEVVVGNLAEWGVFDLVPGEYLVGSLVVVVVDLVLVRNLVVVVGEKSV